MDTNFVKAHIAINVKSVPESIDFHRKLFGMEPSKVRTGYAKFDVENPPLNFTLNENSIQSGLSHLGIQVASTADVLGVRDRWKNEGLFPQNEMNTTRCYAVQDKSRVQDPDGNEWEVFAVLQDNLPETERSCCTSSCCK